MTVDQLTANVSEWFSGGFHLLTAFDFGSMTIGQMAFTIFAGLFCLALGNG
jgi:hypothetical protein